MAGPCALDSSAREASFGALEQERFDLVVIGGGITGAGVLQEAALRGLRVALLEAEDFAAGTSSRSSKLIHGGLRYLAYAEVRLVRETALERKVVFRLAPHLAERRWMVIPSCSRAGQIKFLSGVTLYEALGAVAAEDRHQNWGREEISSQEPLLDHTTWRYACAYREYLTDDARLVLANLRAAVGNGAIALNHAPVRGLITDGADRVIGVEAQCALTGRKMRIHGRSVLNAAGPWVEAVQQLENPGAPSRLHLSKGVHVCLPAERLPLRNQVSMRTKDGRYLAAIRRGEVSYIGPTDTTYERGAALWPEISASDVDYLLEPVARYFRVAPLQAGDIVSAWAGLRPLIAQPGKKSNEISRRSEVAVGRSGLISVAGGKLTGYRPMAFRILKCVADVLGDKPRSRPADEGPLPGGDFAGSLEGLERQLVTSYAVRGRTAERLSRLYGSEAPEVIALGRSELVPGGPVLTGEVDWAVRQEGAARLEDVLYRRTRAAVFDPHWRHALLAPMADRMTALLGWSPQRRQSEIDGTRQCLEAEMRFCGAGLAAFVKPGAGERRRRR